MCEGLYIIRLMAFIGYWLSGGMGSTSNWVAVYSKNTFIVLINQIISYLTGLIEIVIIGIISGLKLQN